MKRYAEHLIGFYTQLNPPEKLPREIEVLFPQKDPAVTGLVKQFFRKYYNDTQQRRLILGINPGRLGAGITGINFTAPKQLTEICGIDHPFSPSSELSAEFIYQVISAYGGPSLFYRDWFIGSVCPLGFTRNGKNINYYDDEKLRESVTPFIIDSIQQLAELGFNPGNCICIGGEKNFRFLSGLNKEFKWFREITPLPHPRFIMQYRRREKEKYIHQYLSVLSSAG